VYILLPLSVPTDVLSAKRVAVRRLMDADCFIIGWEKFYPKGKGRRPSDGKAGESSAKQEGGPVNMQRQVATLAGPITLFLAVTALWNMLRSSNEVTEAFPWHSYPLAWMAVFAKTYRKSIFIHSVATSEKVRS
jgi:hypothetical protein